MRKILDFFINGTFLKSIPFWVVLGLVLVAVWYFRSKPAPTPQIIDTNFKPPVETYKDEKGSTHSVVPSITVTEKTLETLVDSLLSENKRLKNAQSLTQVTQTTDTVFITKILWKDSTKSDFEITHEDNYIYLKATGNVNTQEANISLESKDTLSFAVLKKKHLFKRDEIVVDVSNKSPYNKVQQGRSFTLQEKKPLISFGIMAGYDPFQGKFTYGVGAVLPVFTIKR